MPVTSADNPSQVGDEPLPFEPWLGSLLLERGLRLDLSPGDVLVSPGDQPPGVFAVVSGRIQLAVRRGEGRERIVEIVSQGETFGEASFFSGRRCLMCATALTCCRVLLLPGSSVERLVETYPAASGWFLASMARRIKTLVDDYERLASLASRERVAAYLVDEMAAREGGGAVVELPVAKRVIACQLNMAPETLSRALRDLSFEGLIRVEGSTVLIPDRCRLIGRAWPARETGPDARPGH